MKQFLSIGLLLAAFALEPLHAQDGSPAAKLANIRKIYIGDFGREEGADLVREKIRIRLMKSERFRVVERVEAADAVLTGVAGAVRTYHSSVGPDGNGNVQGDGGTSFSGLGVLRLVDLKTDETVWVYEYKRGIGLVGSVTGRVADKTVEQLLKDAQPRADKKKK
jgi:hypothetical protein